MFARVVTVAGDTLKDVRRACCRPAGHGGGVVGPGGRLDQHVQGIIGVSGSKTGQKVGVGDRHAHH